MGFSVKRVLVLLMLCCFLNGCVTMQHNYRPEIKKVDFPAINTATTVFIGDPMLIQGYSNTREFLHVLQSTGGTSYDISSGYYPKTGSEGTKEFFSASGDTGVVTRGAFIDKVKGLMTDTQEPDKVCVIAASYNVALCYDASYQIEKRESVGANSFQKTLYFSGMEDNYALFMYSEKSNGHVTHTHNVKYDMSNNTTIGYRGAKINILDVSNESITYEVIHNFPDRE
ncbi:MAG: hypothetical protein R3Y11_04260 [Pseudomonadota bacterium]